MRPLRLDLAGFTVFRDETTVDFTDADFFALVGPTGSGKSTVLDAICFALYGQVPRWGSSKGISNALAPSATEARVRLVFEVAGDRYVATRVVRRDSRGTVKTGGAALQLMPRGFDVSKLDTGLSPDDLGEVLAGTPAEMDKAVRDVIGLPYEQFTTCVLLPQGQFADFLHAKPAIRQDILVNLLGLGVYQEIQKLAHARAVRADAQVAAIDQMLDGLQDADAESLARAEARVAEMRRLAEAVDAELPALREAERAVTEATAALAALDADLAELAAVRAPADVTAIARGVAEARAAAHEAAARVAAAEDQEEKVRGALAAGGDPAVLRLRLQEHAERDRLAAESAALATELATVEADHTEARAALDALRAEARQAAERLEAARRAYQEAQATERALALRAHLSPGDTCPVCAQPVATVPPLPPSSALAAAEAAGHEARAAYDAAEQRVADQERVTRELERKLDRVRIRHDQLATRIAELDARLADSPGPAALQRDLDALAELERKLAEAGAAVRRAREAQRRAQAEVARAEERLREAWRRFDATRDALARLGPPATDREDVATAWRALEEWAAGEARRRRAERESAAAAVDAARSAVRVAGERVAGLFTAAGLPAPPLSADASDFPRAAAVAVERAEAELRRLAERQEQARRLREQRAAHERESQVAKALAGHLRANNFERWLLEEALDALVDGASRILRELSSGQYELVHDKGEFYVIDHHDASLRRGVRTLSGGETFQASLALALALSEQLAGMSTTGASLESILLDEGFGTLDSTTLETVATTLENLAARGDRMVGVVTHVSELAERIPVRFEVRKDARSARVERVGL